MSDIPAGYYVYPRQNWSEAQCRRISRMIRRDGLGTPYPFRGYIGSDQQVNRGGYGTERLNGGIVVGDEWYPGVVRLLPQVPEDFEIVHVSTWGYRLVRRQAVCGKSGT